MFFAFTFAITVYGYTAVFRDEFRYSFRVFEI